MNLKVIDENNFIITIIDKKLIPKLDENSISNYLKKILLKIKTKYQINIYGYYDVFIYVDEYYGIIIKLIREELEYLSYYDKEIEMKIIVLDNQFFYEIEDIYKIKQEILDISDIYLYNNQIYLELKSDINFTLYGYLIENSKVIYEDTEKIKKEGNKIEIGW